MTNIKDESQMFFKKEYATIYIKIACLIVPLFLSFLFKITPLFTDKNESVCLFLFAFSLTLISVLYIWIKKVFENKNFYYLFFLILLSSICLRLFIFPYAGTDYKTFLHPWIERLSFLGWPLQIVIPVTNYNPLYTYILSGISHISFFDLYLIKGISVIFDVILAITILFILRKSLKIKDTGGIFGFSLAMLLPSIFLNSSAWGQCESFYTSFLLIGLYLCLRGSPFRGCIFLGLAFSAKLQALFIFPTLLFLFAYKQLGIRHLIFIPLTYLVTILPSWIYGRTFLNIVGIYFDQIQTYAALSNGAPNFWLLFDGEYKIFLPLALCFFMIVILLFTFITLLLKEIKSKNDFWDIAYLYALIIPYFLPKMHERYFYVAVALSIIYLIKYPKLWKIITCFLFLDAFLYENFLFGNHILDTKYISLVLLVIILHLLYNYFSNTKSPYLQNDMEMFPLSSLSKQNNLQTLSKYNNTLQLFKKVLFPCALLLCFATAISIIQLDFQGNMKQAEPLSKKILALSRKKINAAHPVWKEELVQFSEDKIIRPSVNDIARIIKLDDKELIVDWGGRIQDRERFVKNKETGVYQFQR